MKKEDKKQIKESEEMEIEEKAEKIAERELTRKEKIEKRISEEEKEKLAAWQPKTKLGKDVKSGKINKIDDILDKNLKILEEQIVDSLIKVKSDLLLMGQSKGKFGGGKRRAWRQTQRKTKE